MDKLFKKICLLMPIVIILSSLTILFTVPNYVINSEDIDFFSCKDIVKNIENLEMNMTSVIYVKNKTGEWEEYQRIHGNENRIWVSYSKMPEYLSKAFVAVEDQRYYSHSGVDWKRTGAAFLNWIPGVTIFSGNQGGSTITQQLIKNITSDNDQNASRKFREIIRALAIEKMLNKKTILEAYLNTISLGNGICGVQVAANNYFNKDVSELNLTECACLAAITKNPSANNPVSHPEKNKERRQLVLDLMLKQDLITFDEYIEAYDKEIVLDDSQKDTFEVQINSYFVDGLIENIIDEFSQKYSCSTDTASSMLYNGGYKIYASVDMNIQNIMEDVYANVSTYFPQKLKGENVQSSMTIMDYSGHVVGIVGGVGKKTVNRGLNRATSAPRQPGSTMKPLGVYTPAIDNGVIYYSSTIEDKPLKNYYKDGKSGPKEWYGYYAGNMTIQKALERSANTIPCHILKELGIEKSFDFLTNKLKLKHLNEDDKNIASLALGGCTYGVTSLESAAAYAIFGNGGKYYEPHFYYKVERSTGEVVLNATTTEGSQVIYPETSVIMNMLLQNVVYGSQGTGGGIRSYSKMKAYAKTGTSTESNDLWMVAGTPYYVGSVWYGFDHNGTIKNQGAAAQVWKAVMTKVHSKLEVKEFEYPVELEPVKYCRYTGKLAGKNCHSTNDGYFVPGFLPETCDGKHTSMPDSTKTVSEDLSTTSPQSQETSTTEPGSSSQTNTSNGDTSSSVSSSESNTSSENNDNNPSSSPETDNN